MRHFNLVVICLLSTVPLGCATWNKNEINDPPEAAVAGETIERNTVSPSRANTPAALSVGTAGPLSLITSDFVNAMVQMHSLVPARTTVGLLNSDREDAFIRSMQRSLQTAGYGVRWVDDVASGQLLQYRHERESGNTRAHRDLFEVAVGVVEMRRSYRTEANNQTSPVTPLYVRGTDASTIELNDDLFKTIPVGAQSASVSAVDGAADRLAAIAQPVPKKQVAPRSRSADTDSVDARRADVSTRAPLPLPLVALPNIENVFELGGSNYEDILAAYSTVSERHLVFPNDSLRLGRNNKAFLEQMVQRFNPDTDLFSLIGCSIGPTALQGGNAALALGRSSRVREALLFSGIPPGKILDEGCWAGDSKDRTLLRRGVMVTLNRK